MTDRQGEMETRCWKPNSMSYPRCLLLPRRKDQLSVLYPPVSTEVEDFKLRCTSSCSEASYTELHGSALIALESPKPQYLAVGLGFK